MDAKIIAQLSFVLFLINNIHTQSINDSKYNIDSNVTNIGGNNMSKKSRDLVVTRIFNVPVEEVWKAWTDSEYVKKWWGPTGFTCPSAKMDVRKGGISLVCMSAPSYGDLYSTWTYNEIEPLKSIMYVHNLSDKNGNTVDPVKVGMPADFPQNVLNLITFNQLEDRTTKMIVTEYGYTSEQWYNLSKLGLEQCLDKMSEIFIRN